MYGFMSFHVRGLGKNLKLNSMYIYTIKYVYEDGT